MKGIVAFIISILFSLSSFAQQNHFIYVQTDNRQPFYIKTGDKVFSSSSSGYAIVSKLNKGNYELRIGFPKNEWPEQIINVEVTGDAGFLLKNFQEKGWGLYNMQTMQVAMNGNAAANTTAAATTPTTGAQEAANATAAAAEQVNETATTTPTSAPPTIPLENEPVQQQQEAVATAVPEPEKKQETVAATPVTQTATEPGKIVTVVAPPPAKDNPAQTTPTTSVPTPTTPVTTEPANNTAATNDTSNGDIKKLYSINEVEGKAVVYVDNPPQYKDTVKIVLQNQKVAEQQTVATGNATPTTSNTEPVKPTSDGRFLDIDMNNSSSGTPSTTANSSIPAETAEPAKKQKKEKKAKTEEPYVPITTEKSLEFPADGANASSTTNENALTFNSDCKAVATQDEFLKLRGRMAGQKTEQKMTDEAVKYFKDKCYSAEQIRYLAVLYMTDEGKYRFFDSAYPFVSDPQNYATLVNELKDEYYINRFNAMIKK